MVTARNLPKTLAVSGLILATLLGLFLFRKDFQLEARGTLEPVDRHNLFFKANGEVQDILVDHHSPVEPGRLLVQLKNNELSQEIIKVTYDRQSAEELRQAIERRIQKAGDPEGTLLAQLADLKPKISGLALQASILKAKEANLAVRSPIKGQVATWDVDDLLRNRPVTVGQVAMQVSDPAGPWELEVFMCDDRVGHLLRAQRELGVEELPVRFVLKSHSNETFQGTLKDMQDAATQDEKHGHSYRLRIGIDKNELQQRLQQQELSQGTEVIAEVMCGRRSVAYCWFHELLEWVQVRLFAF